MTHEKLSQILGELDDVELSDGGCIEVPEDDGLIRRRDVHGNCEEIRNIDDEDWQEWASLFNLTEDDFDFEEEEVELQKDIKNDLYGDEYRPV